MSYQNVGTPRFYVNTLAYFNALGLTEGSLVEGGYFILTLLKQKYGMISSQQQNDGNILHKSFYNKYTNKEFFPQ